MRKTERVLVLEKFDPKQKDIGLVDPRVFSGQNELRGVMDLSTGLWTLQYKHGHIPPQLRNKFTSFKFLLQHAEAYFKTKNIKIVKVID